MIFFFMLFFHFGYTVFLVNLFCAVVRKAYRHMPDLFLGTFFYPILCKSLQNLSYTSCRRNFLVVYIFINERYVKIINFLFTFLLFFDKKTIFFLDPLFFTAFLGQYCEKGVKKCAIFYKPFNLAH